VGNIFPMWDFTQASINSLGNSRTGWSSQTLYIGGNSSNKRQGYDTVKLDNGWKLFYVGFGPTRPTQG